MKRKPIQIAAIPLTEAGGRETVYALCEDGSIWRRDERLYNPTQWERVPDIPDAPDPL
jgi:hypothetical protein